MQGKFYRLIGTLFLSIALSFISALAEIIPELDLISTNRPRVLLRPEETPFAISLPQLEALPRDAAFNQMLSQLKSQQHAASLALAWLLTGET